MLQTQLRREQIRDTSIESPHAMKVDQRVTDTPMNVKEFIASVRIFSWYKLVIAVIFSNLNTRILSFYRYIKNICSQK